MLGTHSGVTRQLKAVQLSLIPIHCMPHKLELGYVKATKKLNVTTLDASDDLYYTYSQGFLNPAHLRRAAMSIQISCNESNILVNGICTWDSEGGEVSATENPTPTTPASVLEFEQYISSCSMQAILNAVVCNLHRQILFDTTRNDGKCIPFENQNSF